MRTGHVVVSEYDSNWRQQFIDIASELRDALGDIALRIEHVGSTSVEGLCAKPIIDIDVVIRDRSVLADAINALEKAGYRHEGDLGIKGREAFAYEGKEYLQKHHLYVCSRDSEELKRHTAFRDYLRSHPEDVDEYSRIKKEAAELYPYDIDRYIGHKSPFIEKIYEKLGLLEE